MNTYGLKASHVIETGRKYKNYQEKYKMGTRDQMWDFHWAAGSANYTIWAWLYKDYVGRNYQGQAWCAMYASDVVVLALMKYCNLSNKLAIEAAKELYGGDLPYNCQLFVNSHKGDPRLNHTPKAGSPVIFYTGSKYGHFGIVTGVDSNGNGFTSVEGNTSGGADKVVPDGGAVVEKWHSLDSRTYFWHFDYVSESVDAELNTYKIGTGKDGLVTTATTLNIRETPGGNLVSGKSVYDNGEHVFPFEKTFIDGKPWYRTNLGWISASYTQGWVLEDNSLWWYVMPGYSFTVNDWQYIDDKWYYFDNTGYMVKSAWIQYGGNDYYMMADGSMATSAYVRSKDPHLNKYYWVNKDGVWEPQWNTATPDLVKYKLVE